eukprot:COSAG02_NODE_7273_length_3088_cov_2.490800_4_plen_464_part_00
MNSSSLQEDPPIHPRGPLATPTPKTMLRTSACLLVGVARMVAAQGSPACSGSVCRESRFHSTGSMNGVTWCCESGGTSITGSGVTFQSQQHCAASTTNSAAGDAAALVAFKRHGSNAQLVYDDHFSTWVQGGNPCGNGYDQTSLGWYGVKCCAMSNPYGSCQAHQSSTGRVTYVDLSYFGPVSGSLEYFVPLSHLEYLQLSRTDIDGDVALLAGLTRLRGLELSYCSHIYGDLASLQPLVRLGDLDVRVTGCYGDWSWYAAHGGRFGANRHEDCRQQVTCPTGRTPVSPQHYFGNNNCACCSGTDKVLDTAFAPDTGVPDTGACIDPDNPLCTGVDCGSHGICSQGTCTCESGAYTGDRCQHYNACYGINCGDHGSCSQGTCTCESGAYTGDRCQHYNACYDIDCSGDHGSCYHDDGTCHCEWAYTGDRCQHLGAGSENRCSLYVDWSRSRLVLSTSIRVRCS